MALLSIVDEQEEFPTWNAQKSLNNFIETKIETNLRVFSDNRHIIIQKSLDSFELVIQIDSPSDSICFTSWFNLIHRVIQIESQSQLVALIEIKWFNSFAINDIPLHRKYR